MGELRVWLEERFAVVRFAEVARLDLRDAVEAYESVDLAGFTGHASWRVDVLREQKAFCVLKSGDRERGVAEFHAILDRYEREPKVAVWAMSASLRAAADGELPGEIGDRVRAIDELVAEVPV